MREFIGSGWAFPIGTDMTGSVALVSEEQEIEQSIRIILGTSPGERPMRPEFGCALDDYVFAPLSPTTAGRIALEVRESLRRWEPRIEVGDVDVTPHSDDAATLLIEVRYSIRNSNDPRNLVFPFYTIPEEKALSPLVTSSSSPGKE